MMSQRQGSQALVEVPELLLGQLSLLVVQGTPVTAISHYKDGSRLSIVSELSVSEIDPGRKPLYASYRIV